jgi:hypothetical protein
MKICILAPASEQPIYSQLASQFHGENARLGSRRFSYLIGSTTTAVPYARTSVTPCMTSVAS